MTKNIESLFLMFLSVLFLSSCEISTAEKEEEPGDDNGVLIWSDEFDEDGSINSSNWTYEIGRGSNNDGWGNNESQYYTNRSENSFIEDGVLKIIAKKESYQGSQYTSARLITRDKFSFVYGRVDVRAKLPSGGGTWPAIWTLGQNINRVGWPACGEIDIMEHTGNDQGITSSAIHTPSSHGATINLNHRAYDSDVSTGFHVYSINWTVEKIDFMVDDEIHYTYSPALKNNANWPFTLDQFILLNVAMGGSLGGTIDPAFTESTMEIDYVRVYQ